MPITQDRMPNNGRVCIDKRIGWSGRSQKITFTEKITNLKYYVPIASGDRDIRILRYLPCI
jgi:hypothetical protein